MTVHSKYVFDTHAWIEFFQGTEKGRRVADLLEHGEILTPAIVLSEIAYKYERDRPTALEERLNFILKHSAIAAMTNEIAIEAGKIKLSIRKKTKNNIGLSDCLVYVTAQKYGAKTVTGDAHFKSLTDVIFLH